VAQDVQFLLNKSNLQVQTPLLLGKGAGEEERERREKREREATQLPSDFEKQETQTLQQMVLGKLDIYI
jgi:hypothetical protein